MRDVLCVWSPDKPTNVIATELNNRKFTVSVLQPVLAWLLNKEVSDPLVKSLKKAEIAHEIILGIESLLPDTCGECNKEYVVTRQECPGLRCKGCGQGFHQPCLEKLLGGRPTMPALPGSVYWLCGGCSPCYELVSLAGQRARNLPIRRRLNSESVANIQGHPVEPTNPLPAAGQVASGSVGDVQVADVSPLVKVGLPFLWGVFDKPVVPKPSVGTDRKAENLVRVGLPFMWPTTPAATPMVETNLLQDCQLYLEGKCPHGISGKANGGCQSYHRKRCSKFMKWGNQGENGCRVLSCDKAHPTLCPRSLNLECLMTECPYRLHTIKCKRASRARNHPHGHGHGLGGGGHHPQGGMNRWEYHHQGGTRGFSDIRSRVPPWASQQGSQPQPQSGHPGVGGQHGGYHGTQGGRFRGYGGVNSQTPTWHNRKPVGQQVGFQSVAHGGDGQQVGQPGDHAGRVQGRHHQPDVGVGSQQGGEHQAGGDQGFQVVTVQHLLGAIQAVVHQMLQPPGQGLENRHSY